MKDRTFFFFFVHVSKIAPPPGAMLEEKITNFPSVMRDALKDHGRVVNTTMQQRA